MKALLYISPIIALFCCVIVSRCNQNRLKKVLAILAILSIYTSPWWENLAKRYMIETQSAMMFSALGAAKSDNAGLSVIEEVMLWSNSISATIKMLLILALVKALLPVKKKGITSEGASENKLLGI